MNIGSGSRRGRTQWLLSDRIIDFRVRYGSRAIVVGLRCIKGRKPRFRSTVVPSGTGAKEVGRTMLSTRDCSKSGSINRENGPN